MKQIQYPKSTRFIDESFGYPAWTINGLEFNKLFILLVKLRVTAKL